jgi:hypothetical protein
VISFYRNQKQSTTGENRAKKRWIRPTTGNPPPMGIHQTITLLLPTTIIILLTNRILAKRPNPHIIIRANRILAKRPNHHIITQANHIIIRANRIQQQANGTIQAPSNRIHSPAVLPSTTTIVCLQMKRKKQKTTDCCVSRVNKIAEKKP